MMITHTEELAVTVDKIFTILESFQFLIVKANSTKLYVVTKECNWLRIFVTF